MLKIEKVDWHLLENGKEHHTDKFEIVHEESTPVLRRAQPFKLSLILNRPFNEDVDKITLQFNYVKKTSQPRIATIMEDLTVTSSNKIISSNTLWSLQLESQKNNSVTVLVRSPPVAAWGTWELSAKLINKLDAKATSWKCSTLFWLLFNPWAKEDEVYMPDTKFLDEYVLNDVGKVYTSSYKKPIGKLWIYGQFAAPVLKVIKYFLDNSRAQERKLGSPVTLSLVLLEANAIVEGKWEGSFADGTAPTLWTGSIPIFEEFFRTKKQVKYAQCFVYAGLFTTVLRAVGIPSRNVSNFISSTVGNDTMSFNLVYDSDGDQISKGKIWNFHVWNDAWMARYDLPTGYGGWQAVDFQGLGPAPVAAVRRGEINISFEVDYVMSECNSDRVRWTVDKDGDYHLVKVDTDHMGKAMLTKQPFIFDPHGDTDFQDIVSLYKEAEGSKEERLAVYNAMKYCKSYKEEYEEEKTEEEKQIFRKKFGTYPFHTDIADEDDTVTFKLKQIESILFGEPVLAELQIENFREEPITVEACLGARSVYYNSALAGRIKRQRKSVTVKPKSEGAISVLIKAEEYAAKLVEFTLLNMHCIASIVGNNYTWADDYQFNVEMPEMIITTKTDLYLNKEGIIVFQFKNLLKVKLTKCSITYEAPGIGHNVKITVRDIKEEEDVTIEHKVKPVRSGDIQINAQFTSTQLGYLSGSSTLQVF